MRSLVDSIQISKLNLKIGQQILLKLKDKEKNTQISRIVNLGAVRMSKDVTFTAGLSDEERPEKKMKWHREEGNSAQEEIHKVK